MSPELSAPKQQSGPPGCPNRARPQAADEDAGEAVDQSCRRPHAKGEDAEKYKLSDGERNIAPHRAAQTFGGQIAADEDVGVGEQV